MDFSEQIVRAWLETKGFLVKSRLKFKVKRSERSAGWTDIDLMGYHLKKGKKVAVDISAWMTENISKSYVKPNSDIHYRLFKSSYKDSRKEIRKFFKVNNDDDYEIWLVVSFISETQKEEVLEECYKHVDKVFEFPNIMREIIDHIKENPNPPRDNESLQTIRALILCDLV